MQLTGYSQVSFLYKFYVHPEHSQLILTKLMKIFSTIAGIVVKENSPLRRVGVSPFPRWFSSSLKNLVITKKTFHKKYKQHPTAYNYLRFSNVRASCKSVAGRDYLCMDEEIERGIPGNLLYFWSHVNTLN